MQTVGSRTRKLLMQALCAFILLATEVGSNGFGDFVNAERALSHQLSSTNGLAMNHGCNRTLDRDGSSSMDAS